MADFITEMLTFGVRAEAHGRRWILLTVFPYGYALAVEEPAEGEPLSWPVAVHLINRTKKGTGSRRKMMAEEQKTGIPARLIFTIRVDVNMRDLPAELIGRIGSIEAFKAWAQVFKEDMEADPDFGKYVRVTVSSEEVI